MVSSHGTCRNVFRWRSSCAITALVVRALSFAAATDSAVAAAIDAAVDAVDSMNPKLSQDLYRLAKDDVVEILDAGADTCDNWRRRPHQDCIAPDQCGKGWLFRRKGLLLAVVFPRENDASAPATGTAGDGTDHWTQQGARPEGKYEWHTGTSGTVNVVGLVDGGEGELSDCNSQDLSMLLRFQGPEALAESAIPVTGRCAWTVQFQPTLEGVYTLDVTLLDWKGGLVTHPSKCNEVVGQYGEGSVEMDAIMNGPFYGTFEACCTLCTRAEGCVAWSSTSKTDVRVNGSLCALYSSVVGEPVADERLGKTIRSGTSREEEAMMYLGPSMTIGRKFCAERNTKILGSGQQFTVAPSAAAPQEEGPALMVSGSALPLCSASTTSLPRDGRWVSLRGTQCDLDTAMAYPPGWPAYNDDTFGVAMPEECFLKPFDTPNPIDDLQFAQGGHVWQPSDCRYDLMNSEARLSCFRDKNITRFLDFGDSLVSTSRMARSALWLPTADSSVWSNGKGAPQIGEGAKEAGCVGAPFQYYGESDGQAYCGAGAYWPFKAGQVTNFISSFKPDVVLANWAIVHQLWHTSLEQFEGFLEGLGKRLDDMAEQDGHIPRYMFWLSAPFLVSEREPHCVLERGLRFTEAMRRTLEPRGWIEIDWTNMTQKWGLDILDGMHHTEPATRMLAYLLMHQVCHASE